MAVRKAKRRTRAPLQRHGQQVLKSKAPKNHEPEDDLENKKAAVIAQEIKFSRLLASNDKKVRDKILKNLKKWLTVRSKSSFAFTETDFMRLWRGLYYCMWMSDKFLIQEELAESLSRIVHCFKVKDVVVLYTTCALKSLGTEWFGIDQYRIDKFAMLVRRIIRQTFQVCKEYAWNMEWIRSISDMFETLLLDPKICHGFNMHITEVYLEELSKISEGDIAEDVVTILVKPFAVYLMKMDDERHIKHVMKHIFRCLIFQSDVGMDYVEKFEAWKQAGFPTGSINAMEKIEISDEEMDEDNSDVEETKLNWIEKENNEDRPLDPRAGRVNVELPQIPFNAGQIASLFSQYKFHPSSTTKSRRQILHLIKEFTELSEGKMPLGIKEIAVSNVRKKDTDSKTAALRLLKFENELYSDSTKKRGKRKKNNQVVDEDEETLDESLEDSITENDMAKVDESEIVQKRRKVHDASAADNLTLTDSQQPNIVLDSKRKKNKTEKKTHIIREIKIQSNNCKSKKDTSILINSKNGRCKKKVKSKLSTLNVLPFKRKELKKIKTCGKWDVSDNITPPIPSSVKNNTQTQVEVSEKIQSPVKENSIKLNEKIKWLIPVSRKLENTNMKKQNISSTPPILHMNSNAKRRVKIVLNRNTAQHTSEYIQQIRLSPGIPFDANKKPLAGVLKASPIPSPINPFYKKNMK